MNENTPATPAAESLARNYTYNFKAMLPAALEELLQGVDLPAEQVRAEFDVVEKDGRKLVKRKSVTVALELPAFAAALPALAQDVLLQYVASYAKATYIDQFLPVGPHGWELIEAYAAARGTGGALLRPGNRDR
jgi:hypothetical protein